MELDLQGNIEQFTLPEIFQLVASGRKSGTLGIQQEDTIVMIYFQEGEIIYGYGPRETFHIGSLLKDKGIISSEQLDEAVRQQAKTENTKRLGEILISKNYIDKTDLNNVVTNQIEELLYSLLTWKSGTFKFYENQFPTDEEITVKVSVENVILEGLRRTDEMNMVKMTLPDINKVYTISATQGDRPRDLSMKADEWNIMALVDGHKNIDEICQMSHLSREKTLVKLAQLKLAGLITPYDRPKSSGSSGAPDLENMINHLAGLFEDYLTAKSESRLDHRQTTNTFVENLD